ncbi:hypothetical protein ACFXPA_27575 [Amycolatopsis sp. NPDC059090]|uniref:hypothetical protein n=1 Tax=unclassified Amycolatopsis TaxID=2618356 RepID=UPI0036706FF8
MREAGVSNKGLAKRMRDLSKADRGPEISPSHTNVDKWLSGETKQPQPRTCQVLVKVLSQLLGRPVRLDEVGYGDTAAVAAEGADSTLEYPETLTASAVALTQLANYELRPDDAARKLQVVPEAWDGLLAKWMFGGDTERSMPVEPRQLHEMDVHAVRDATGMFSNFDYRYGGGRPKPLVARFLETEVLPLIPHVSPHTPLGREYFREVAALTRLAGWTAYDIGQHALAQRYLYQAFRLARAGGDKALCGRILAGMSHQANFIGDYERAVHLARAAIHGATGHATPTTMALFHAMEARALASQNNQVEAAVALSAAETWLCRSEPDNDPEWIRYFDQAELHAEFAHCFRDLGDADRAAEHAAASIATSKNIYVRSLSFCRTVLATAHLQANELDQALEIARGVVDTAADLKSFRVVSYLKDFRQRLSERSKESAVIEFGDYFASAFPSKDLPASGKLIVA